MRNITFDEWSIEIVKVAEHIRMRWPWLRIESDNSELNITSSSCSGCVRLRSSTKNQSLFPKASIELYSGISQNTKIARMQISDSIHICDALDVADMMVSHYRVWTQGKCPCDSCNSHGAIKGKKCNNCDNGVR